MTKKRRPYLHSAPATPFAHRGGARLWPENTLLAFQGALDLGIRYIETDVHLTRDGQIVVFHDHRLERTTDGTGFVRDHTLAELERLDAGYRFSPDGKAYPQRASGVRIPTLAEAIALDPSLRLNIEIKERAGGLPAALFRFIEHEALHERVLVAAFEHALIREFRALARGSVATSASQREVIAFWLAVRARSVRFLPIGYDALQVPVRHGRLEVVEPRFIGAAHARDLAVHVWTIDDPAEMRRLAALGVDGIMSDRPDLLYQTLAEPALG
jgi:glycerophosphoryl diester phosphodiesterase